MILAVVRQLSNFSKCKTVIKKECDQKIMERNEIVQNKQLKQLVCGAGLKEELIPVVRIPALLPSAKPGRQLSMVTVYRWIENGKLPTRKIGGRRYVTADDLVAFINGGNDETPAHTTPTASAEKAGRELDLVLSRKGAQK